MSSQILPILDYKFITEEICRFLQEEFKKRNKVLAILGVSGGIDSAVVDALCKKAGLNLREVFMPYGESFQQPQSCFVEIDITSTVDQQIREISKYVSLDKIDKGNIMARTRMIIQYALARQLNGLVVGTENLSEYYLGYFTLHGDEASDINPISGLFKTQMLELAKYLKVSEKILKQKPSAGLYKNQTDESELGFSYQEADPILYFFYKKKLSPEKIIKDFDIKADLVYKVLERVKVTEYKRKEVPKYVPQ